MRHVRILLLMLTAMLLTVAARADVIYGPGLCRADAAKGTSRPLYWRSEWASA